MIQSWQMLLLATVAVVVVNASSSHQAPSLNEPFQTSFAQLRHAPCVSLMHRNGRLGCGTAERDVQTGKLLYHDGSTSSFASIKEPYVVVIEEENLSNEVMSTLYGNNAQGYWQGVLVLNTTLDDDDASNFYSPDAANPRGTRTPSQYTNYGNSVYKWNANGDGLMQTDLFGIPMAYVSEQDVSAYLRVVAQDAVGNDKADVLAEFNYYMGPSEMDSKTCLAWKDASDDVWRPKCLPLGGTSVWAAAGSPDKSARPLVVVGTNLDAASLFHDATPGANTAASNILAVLMAAKLIGEHVLDAELDVLTNRIVFGFFQGESYGFLGSRAFLKDVIGGFQCSSEELTVSSSVKLGNDTFQSCLYPMRPSLEFQKLGDITGMITVDQVGVLATEKTMYIHEDAGDFGSFVSGVLQASSTNGYSVTEVEVSGDDDNFDDDDVSVPPTPLTSLLSITQGAVGGAVLSGYGTTFNGNAYYNSQQDSIFEQELDMDAIATAATLLARAALAAAFDDGQYDSESAAAYALTLIPNDLSSTNETLLEMADCLFVSGYCDMIQNYAKMEASNEKARTGVDLGVGPGLGSPPNYYVSIYDVNNGQPFVQVGGNGYGAYNGKDYGKKSTDFVAFRPSALEMAVHGMLNDFLGRSSWNATEEPDIELKSCKATQDCSKVTYCSEEGDFPVCSGGNVCVCSRAHYHSALDEALLAAPNNSTSYFVVSEQDEGISAMYTEPFWSNSVGVRIYKDGSNKAGNMVLLTGLLLAGACVFSTWVLKRKMKKEKLY